MKRPRPRRLTPEERARRKAAQQQRRWDRMTRVDPVVTARAVRRSRVILACATAGFVVAVAVAVWLAARPDVVELTWGIGFGGRFSGTVRDVRVARGDLVPVAVLLAGLPVVLAAIGVVRTPPATRPGAAPARWLSGASGVAAAGALGAAPNVVGCYLLSYHGADEDLMLIPELWPQLSVYAAVFIAAWWSSRRRRPRFRRTLSGTKVPV